MLEGRLIQFVFLKFLMEKEMHWDATIDNPEKKRGERLSDERRRLEAEVHALVERLRDIQMGNFFHRCLDILRERREIQKKLEETGRRLKITMSALEDLERSLRDLSFLDDEEEDMSEDSGELKQNTDN